MTHLRINLKTISVNLGPGPDLKVKVKVNVALYSALSWTHL